MNAAGRDLCPIIAWSRGDRRRQPGGPGEPGSHRRAPGPDGAVGLKRQIVIGRGADGDPVGTLTNTAQSR